MFFFLEKFCITSHYLKFDRIAGGKMFNKIKKIIENRKQNKRETIKLAIECRKRFPQFQFAPDAVCAGYILFIKDMEKINENR